MSDWKKQLKLGLTNHPEPHFTGSRIMRDIVIGMSDGLTVPFALAAGLSGAVIANGIIVTAGFAEIAAGSIAMGLGGYLAAKSDAEHYHAERIREETEVIEKTDAEIQEIIDIFDVYGVSTEESMPVVKALQRNPQAWVDFMMRFELELEKPDPNQAVQSALTIALSYIFGGLIPLAPYILMSHPMSALYISVAVTILALAVFGFIKGKFTKTSKIRSAFQTVLIGGLAAAAAFLIARSIA